MVCVDTIVILLYNVLNTLYNITRDLKQIGLIEYFSLIQCHCKDVTYYMPGTKRQKVQNIIIHTSRSEWLS